VGRTIPTDNKGVVHYVEQVFRATVIAAPGEANEPVVIDLQASKKKRIKEDSKLTKQVQLRIDRVVPS
jgi:hypothetical protein